MKILCLDQATKISGYSVFKDSKLLKYGILNADEEEKNPIERMKQMNEKIIKLINSTKPSFVVFEDTQYQNNFSTFQQLSQLQGVIMAFLFEKNIGFSIIQPTAWKSVAGVKGRKRIEQKSSAIQIIKNTYNIDVSEDEADAILIGHWAIRNIKSNN